MFLSRFGIFYQAIIANQIERINQTRINRAHSVPTILPEIENSNLISNQHISHHLNNLAILRQFHQMNQMNQDDHLRSQSQSIAMTQNLSQMTLGKG